MRVKIFRDCLCELLQGTTRVLITKNINLCLPASDNVLVMNEGEIIEQGPFAALMKRNGPLCELMASSRVLGLEEPAQEEDSQDPGSGAGGPGGDGEDSEEEHESDKEIVDTLSKRALLDPKNKRRSDSKQSGRSQRSDSAMTTDEKHGRPAHRGHETTLWTYMRYFRASGGLLYFLFLVVVFTVSQFGHILMDFWLNWWISRRFDGLESSLSYYDVYVYVGLAVIALILLRSLFVAYGSIRASNQFNDDLMTSLFQSSVTFFEQTPFGLIMTRIGRDLQGIEQILSSEISDLFTFVFTTAGTLVVITVITPYFIVAMLPVSLAFAFIANYYIHAARQLKKLDQQTRVGIYQHFNETLQGLTTIRAMEASRDFVLESETRVDANHRSYWSLMVANRWLGLHLEFVGSMVVFFGGLFVILYRFQLTGAAAGLSLTYALSVTNTLNWLVRTIAEVDTGLSNVERVLELQKSAKALTPPSDDWVEPPSNWPSKGKISIANLTVRGPNPTQQPLQDVSLETKAMEKIGIVGAKNSGKSLLINALFRLSPFDAGSIRIDNVDISQLKPRRLRSFISVIPKDFLVFSGTVRENLDPYGERQDYDIWAALRKVCLDELVSEFSGGLDAELGPDSLSFGQKYLMAFARILLTSNKVVVLDELPSFDPSTDALIQKTIRMHFTDSTVLCVSRVLKNIIDYDRVAVMDKGRVVEFGSPASLLANTSSRFYQMCRQSGDLEQLKQLAGQKEYVLEELSASVQSHGSAELGSSFVRGQLFQTSKPGTSSGTFTPGSHGSSPTRYPRQNYLRSRSFVGSMVN